MTQIKCMRGKLVLGKHQPRVKIRGDGAMWSMSAGFFRRACFTPVCFLIFHFLTQGAVPKAALCGLDWGPRCGWPPIRLAGKSALWRVRWLLWWARSYGRAPFLVPSGTLLWGNCSAVVMVLVRWSQMATFGNGSCPIFKKTLVIFSTHEPFQSRKSTIPSGDPIQLSGERGRNSLVENRLVYSYGGSSPLRRPRDPSKYEKI